MSEPQIDNFSYQKIIFWDFSNLELHDQKLLGLTSEYWQKSRGKLETFSQQIDFQFLSVYHDIFNLGFMTSGVIPENKIVFHIPRSKVNKPQGFFCTNSFDQNSLLIAPSNSSYNGLIHRDISIFSLFIDRGFFQDYFQKVSQVALGKIINKSGSFLKVTPGQFTALKKWLEKLFLELEGNYQSLANKYPMQIVIQETLLNKLTEILLRQKNEIISESKSGSHLLAKSAREFIDSHYFQPLTIKEVCEAIGASERTLRYGFKEVFGLNPKQYLKIHRLNIAHRQLLRGNSATKSVTDIALDSGCWHLGRFSRDYKLLFDESPLETLRK